MNWQAGCCVGVAGAVGDGNKPAWAGNKRGHFAGGGVEVRRWAGGCFNGVGKAAGLYLRKGKLAVALTWILRAERMFIMMGAALLSGARPVVVNLRLHHHGDGGLRVVNVERAACGNQFDEAGTLVVVADIQGNGNAVATWALRMIPKRSIQTMSQSRPASSCPVTPSGTVT